MILDEFSDGFRDSDSHGVDWRCQLPAPIVRFNQAFGYQVLDCIDHEERIALSPLVNDRAERARKAVSGKSRGEVLPHGRLSQVFELQFRTLVLRDKLSLHCLEGVSAVDQFRWPIGTDQHQVGGLATTGDRRNQIHRREVAPMQVFQDEHQRRIRRQRIQSVAHFPQHPFARRARGFAAKEFAIRGRQYRG